MVWMVFSSKSLSADSFLENIRISYRLNRIKHPDIIYLETIRQNGL